MLRQCQYQVPIQFSDNRRCYRTSGSPGFVIILTLVAVLAGYAGLASATVDNASDTRTSSATSASSRSGDLSLPS